MTERVPQSADAAPESDCDEFASVRVDRAQTELRRGRPVVLESCDPSAPLLIVAAIETLCESRLRSLQGWGATPRLLLTAERLQALQGPQKTAAARSLAFGPAVTLQALQRLAAVCPGGVDLHGLDDARPASVSMEAALLLAKRARLTPALVVSELPPSSRNALHAAHVLQVSGRDIGLAQSSSHKYSLRRVSDARLPITGNAECTLVLFREIDGAAEHLAVLFGAPDPTLPVAVRVHSSCLTGDLLGSLRCDCGDQLRDAIDHLSQAGGVLLYLAQEGRGTGLANKLRAYRLQDGGLDTIDADRHLGFRDDERDFGAAVAMLKLLGITRVRLLTNNPDKIESLRSGGIDVVDRVALVAGANAHNARYLETKRERAGHLGRVNTP